MAEVCLRNLARTCETLTASGIRASAVVAADDENLEIARSLGFGTVERENEPLGRKWNDLYELSAIAGVDYVVPFGSDDWIDPAAILAVPLPGPNEIRCFRRSAVVNESATRLARLRVVYASGEWGGDGVRILPTAMLEPLGYRPAEEDRNRAIDTSVLRNIRTKARPRIVYHDLHDVQIVDWKSHGEQLNTYDACSRGFRDGPEVDPWSALEPHYPAVALDEMRALHVAVAA